MEKASFGAGCFWGVQEKFQSLKGVVSTQVGYQGGNAINPSYEDVCSDLTGHTEVVLVTFDPNVISFEKLLDLFWKIHDPRSRDRQGYDVGQQYRSVIFCTTPEQLKEANESKSRQRPGIVTEILMAPIFYPAEEYHQCYLQKRRKTS